jgi:hypothetical protein
LLPGSAARLGDEALEKAQHRDTSGSCAGVAYIPPAANGTAKLKLTSQGKRVVGTTTKRRVRGVMEIGNMAGTAISSTRITFKLKKRP